jgi:hypothetical protein
VVEAGDRFPARALSRDDLPTLDRPAGEAGERVCHLAQGSPARGEVPAKESVPARASSAVAGNGSSLTVVAELSRPSRPSTRRRPALSVSSLSRTAPPRS